jgi:hypothetical protein
MADKFQLASWAVNTEDVMYGRTFTVATLPTAVASGIIYVSDGAAGSPILAFSNGTNWLRSDTGAAVSAT